MPHLRPRPGGLRLRSTLGITLAVFAVSLAIPGAASAQAAAKPPTAAVTKTAVKAAVKVPAMPKAAAMAAAAVATGPITGYAGLCVDDQAASTTNFNPIQVYTCNGTAAQQWTVAAGNTLQVLGKCMDINGGGTANGTTVDLYDCNGTGAQVWVPQSNGALLNPQSNRCLDDTNWSTTPGTQLQIWDCSGNANQQWNLPTPSAGGSPFGPNVLTFDPSMSSATIQNQINSVYNQQQTNQFGTSRYALLFKPGTYNVDIPVGFYTQVLGLGFSPNDTSITGGGVHVDAAWNGGNATTNFWRSAENLTIAPSSGSTKWAVSQASPLRRVHVKGNMVLDDNGGWSSGGFLGDSQVDGQVNSGSQQQWISRNDQLGSWTGSNWNMVFVGTTGAPAQSFPYPPYTTVGQTPVMAEQPFLYVDGSGNYNVFVPANRTNSVGTTWANGAPAGTSLPISSFYIATPSDTAATINAQLAAGKNVVFTPGVYQLNGTINVSRADTVLLGLGLATLVANNGGAAISVADVNGVKVAGLLIDAGTTNSSVLMQVGPTGSTADHSADPTVLSDVYFRIGGGTLGKATQSLQVNSNNVLGDNLWLWRADHGNGVGWTSNTAANGLVVNGANVTMYGLAVEHYQQYQVIWNGNGGRTYFYQSEMPYDVPNQASWMNGSGNGFASYKVANNVTSHQAYGLGVYCYFSTNSSVVADRAIEVPTTSGVPLRDMVTVSLGGTGTISHIVNNTGGPSNSSTTVANLVSYP